MFGLAVVDAISDNLISIGTRLSYKVGACRIIPAVPKTTAIVNIHKNNRSNTIATYFQSSFTLVLSSSFLVWSAIYLTPSMALCSSGQVCHRWRTVVHDLPEAQHGACRCICCCCKQLLLLLATAPAPPPVPVVPTPIPDAFCCCCWCNVGWYWACILQHDSAKVDAVATELTVVVDFITFELPSRSHVVVDWFCWYECNGGGEKVADDVDCWRYKWWCCDCCDCCSRSRYWWCNVDVDADWCGL